MKKGFLCKIKFYFVVCMWEVFYGVFFYCSNFWVIEKLYLYVECIYKVFSLFFYMYVIDNKILILIKKDVNLDSMLYYCCKMFEIIY